MKNKILICAIVFVFAMINISCSHKLESNNISLGTSSENDSENDSKDDSEDTDEYFVDKYSIYRNPIIMVS